MDESSVSVKLDEQQFRRIQSLLRAVPNKIPQVMSGAINKTAASTKVEIARLIAAKAKMKQKGIKKGIWIQKATRRRWLATLNITSRRIPLIYLKVRKTKKGVVYQGPGDVYANKQKIGKAGLIASAFKQKMPKSGHKGVFLRRAGAKHKMKKGGWTGALPIDELFGPSIGELFEGAMGIVMQTTKSIHEKLSKNIDAQIKYILEKRKAG